MWAAHISAHLGPMWAPHAIVHWVWGGPWGGVAPPNMSKYLSVKYLLISKQTGTLSQAVQKIDLWGVQLAPPNYVKTFVC